MKACKFCATQVENNVTRCPSCGGNVFLSVCENCGTQFESAFCPNCGVKAGQKKKICPECHSAYFSNACPNCGYTEIRKPVTQKVIHEHVYVEPEKPAPTPPPVKQQSKRKGKGCGCLVWVIIILTIIGVIANSGSKKSTKSSSYTSTTTRKPSVTATKDPTPTATPDPAVVAAQNAVDAYIASEEAAAGVTSTPDPETLTASEKARLQTQSILNDASRKTIRAHFASYLNGRGQVDTVGKEPDYVGVIGYAVVGAQQDMDRKSDYTVTPWTVPTYKKDKQFWEEAGSIDHKTQVVVISQELGDKSGSGKYRKYKGYLQVIRMDTQEMCYLDVTNFVADDYWSEELTEAIKGGYCIAEFHQVSDFYPVTRGNGKVDYLEDGEKILLPYGTSYYSSPDRENNPIEGVIFKDGARDNTRIFFNPADLTLVY